MAVAYQTQKKGIKPAGLELFDISVPENPRSISFFDCSGEHSRGVHQLWFCDGEYVHMASGAPDFKNRAARADDQFYRCIDVRNPERARRGRPAGGCPAPRCDGDALPRRAIRSTRTSQCAQHQCVPAAAGPALSSATSTAACSSWILPTSPRPQGYLALDQLAASPGFMHTAVPLFDRNLMLVTDESTEDKAADWPKLIWVLDARDEQHLIPRAACPLPPLGSLQGPRRPLRRAQHSRECAGAEFVSVRPACVRHVLQQGACAPTTFPTRSSRRKSLPSCRRRRTAQRPGAIQLNDVYVDERQIVHTVDRFTGRLYFGV